MDGIDLMRLQECSLDLIILLFFSHYADRFPNHEACSRIDSEHAEEIEKLRGEDGDFHHGFNSGLLAATRLFKEKADILHINDFKVRPIYINSSSKVSEIFFCLSFADILFRRHFRN